MKSFHKKALCLLLAGTMTLSLLSGCGGKDAGSNPGGPQNSTPPVTASDAGGQNTPEASAPEQSAPAANVNSNPLFDSLAFQFHDVVITPGMTLGQAVAAIDASELPLTYPDEFSAANLLQEKPVPGTGTYRHTRADRDIYVTGQMAFAKDFRVECDGSYAFAVCYFDTLPGEEGDTYRMEDLIVFGVRISSSIENEYSFKDDVSTYFGTGAELDRLSVEEVESIFGDENGELPVVLTVEEGNYGMYDEEDRYIHIPTRDYQADILYAPYDFQQNGYTLRQMDTAIGSDTDICSRCGTSYSFEFDEDGNMLSWRISVVYNAMSFWIADSAE